MEANEDSSQLFLDPQNPETPVWHYMSLPKFISMLDTQEICLVRVDLMADPFEGALPRKVSDRIKEMGETCNYPPKEQARSAAKRKESRSNIYISCWHLSPYESEAMWRLYSPSGEGVVIKSTYKSLKCVALESSKHAKDVAGIDVSIGRIHYIDYEKDIGLTTWPNIKAAHMYKRKAFEHEKEIRLLHLDSSNKDKDEHGHKIRPLVKGIHCDLAEVIHGIYVAPYSQKWFKGVVESVLSKFAPSLEIQVQQSELIQDPQF